MIARLRCPALWIIAAIVVAACSPATPRSGSEGPSSTGQRVAPSRTLSIAMRLEPSDITSSSATYNRIGLAVFGTGYHGGLAFKDQHEMPHPLLVETLPQLNS